MNIITCPTCGHPANLVAYLTPDGERHTCSLGHAWSTPLPSGDPAVQGALAAEEEDEDEEDLLTSAGYQASDAAWDTWDLDAPEAFVVVRADTADDAAVEFMQRKVERDPKGVSGVYLIGVREGLVDRVFEVEVYPVPMFRVKRLDHRWGNYSGVGESCQFCGVMRENKGGATRPCPGIIGVPPKESAR